MSKYLKLYFQPIKTLEVVELGKDGRGLSELRCIDDKVSLILIEVIGADSMESVNGIADAFDDIHGIRLDEIFKQCTKSCKGYLPVLVYISYPFMYRADNIYGGVSHTSDIFVGVREHVYAIRDSGYELVCGFNLLGVGGISNRVEIYHDDGIIKYVESYNHLRPLEDLCIGLVMDNVNIGSDVVKEMVYGEFQTYNVNVVFKHISQH